jgi:hypothetical protein
VLAARVAALLRDAQCAGGRLAGHCFEIAETRGGEPAAAVWPETLKTAAAAAHLLHLHSSADWPGLLDRCASLLGDASRRLVITLHDATLATGGCPYPLDCQNFADDCRDPCPRGFPQSQARRRGLRGRLLQLAPALVSPSAWMQRLVQDSIPGITVALAPNGVEWPETLPSREEARRRFGLGPQARLCIFVAHGGDKAAYKAGDHWRSLWEAIKSAAPDAVGFFVGGQAAATPAPDLFCWPYVEQEQLRAMFRAADLFAYPTLADNHPLLVLEAMASGCAPLAFAVGGVPEQIQDVVTGRLVRPGDATAFIEAAVALLKERRLARRLGEQAFQRGKERFAYGRMAAAYERVYEGEK